MVGPCSNKSGEILNKKIIIWKIETNQRQGFQEESSSATQQLLQLFRLSLTGSFGKGSLVADAEAGAAPDSNFGGVQIGAITYSWRSMPGGVDNVIKYCIESGISSIELMSGDVESDLGAPKNPMQGMMGPRPPAHPPLLRQLAPLPTPPAGAPPAAPAGPPQRRELTPEQQAAVTKYNQDLKQWRLSVPMSKFTEMGKKFNNAGIKIHIVKFSPARWSDEEIDYAFKAAKAIGCQRCMRRDK